MDIHQPTLLLDEEVCRENISAMSAKAKKHQLKFKPHMKTHQSATVGRWVKEAGAQGITVSSVKMAQYFARNGWKDITVAFPCNILEIKGINDLAKRVSLTLLVNKTGTAKRLQQILTAPVNVYVEIDSGSHRSGLPTNKINNITRLLNYFAQADKLKWVGFYSHPGQSYAARSYKEILQIHYKVLEQVGDLREELESTFGTFEVCVGDTPCCSAADSFEGIDAISPGNFIFYDLMQSHIGSCEIGNIATAMACPVVDVYAGRKEIVIYGGAVHFSKEALRNDFTCYGRPAIKKDIGWALFDDTSYVKALSQEHGIISSSEKLLENYSAGDIIHILPVHSCLTANLMNEYRLLNGTSVTQL